MVVSSVYFQLFYSCVCVVFRNAVMWEMLVQDVIAIRGTAVKFKKE